MASKIESARRMRHAPTAAEARLWSRLRNRQMQGLKFRRQAPVGSYIADFLCESAKVIIEVDGGRHADQRARDAKRTSQIEAMGYLVVRVWNVDVLANLFGELEEIWRLIQSARCASRT